MILSVSYQWAPFSLPPWPFGGLLGSGSLGRGVGSIAGAQFGSLAVLQLTTGSPRAGPRLWEVWTHQSVFLLTLVVRDMAISVKSCVFLSLFFRHFALNWSMNKKYREREISWHVCTASPLDAPWYDTMCESLDSMTMASIPSHGSHSLKLMGCYRVDYVLFFVVPPEEVKVFLVKLCFSDFTTQSLKLVWQRCKQAGWRYILKRCLIFSSPLFYPAFFLN